jgi:YVTN family beta-propeller protein/YD repeat-containing protein
MVTGVRVFISLVLALAWARAAAADVVYLYDGLDRLVKVIDEAGRAAVYVYDPVGNLLQIGRQSGVPQDQTAIASLDPPDAGQGAEVTLTVTGTNLAGATLPALPPGFTLTSSSLGVSANLDVLTLRLALAPNVPLGVHPLTLVSSLGQAPLPFSLNVVLPPPRVDRLIPPLVTMGSLVQIEGNAFDDTSPGQNQVTINGVPLPVVSVKPTALIARIVPGATTGPVTVATARGSGTSAAPLAVVPASHPQGNTVTATLRSPFRAPARVAVSPDGARAYVINSGQDASAANRGGNSVTVVDALQHEVIGVVPIGPRPASVAVTPDGSRVLVAKSSSSPFALIVINAATLGVVGSVSLASGPQDIIVSPNGAFAYVAAGSSVAVINLSTLSIETTIPAGAAFLAASPDGATVYAIGSTVSVIDAASRAVVKTISLGSDASAVSFALDIAAQRLYVGVSAGVSRVAVVNLATGTLVGTIPISGASAVALSPDRTRLYVVGTDTQLKVVNTSTLATVGTVTVGPGRGFGPGGIPGPFQALAVNSAGTRLWVANRSDGTVSVVDPQARSVVATVPVGAAPSALALLPAGSSLYVLNHSGNIVSVLDTETDAARPTALDSFGLSRPLGLVAASDGSAAYVVNDFAPATTALDPATGVGLATLPVGDSHEGLHLAVSLTRNELYAGSSSPTGVAVVDLETRALKGLLPLARAPAALALSLDERRLYVADTSVPPRLATFDTASRAQLAEIPLDRDVVGLAVNPEGTRLYVLQDSPATSNDGLLRVIDTATQVTVASIAISDSRTTRLAFNRTGQRLYVVNDSTITVIDPQTNQVVATIPLGGTVRNLVFSLDGSKAYAGKASGATGVAVIDTATNAVRATITTSAVRALELSADGQRLFATREGSPGSVTVVNTTVDQVVATIPVGVASTGAFGGLIPINVTSAPDGSRVWVVNTLDDSISVIE